MGYCPKCGTNNGEEAEFCGSCGASLTNQTSVGPAAEGKGFPLIKAIIAVVIILAAGGAAWALLGKLDKGPSGGVYVVLQAVATPHAPVTADSFKRAEAIIAYRVNQLGVSHPIIQTQGSDRIVVQFAGVKDPDQVVTDLITPAFLQFKNQAGTTILTDADLKNAQEATTPSGQQAINLTLTSAGAKKFAAATKAAAAVTPHQHIGIYLDKELLENPVVLEEIPNGMVQISGGFAKLQDAHNLAVLLRSGALPVKLKVLKETTK